VQAELAKVGQHHIAKTLEQLVLNETLRLGQRRVSSEASAAVWPGQSARNRRELLRAAFPHDDSERYG
jgi:hypothetical protein